jgi:cobalt-zinc-cadmium efflux system membrane fusion protein
MTFRFALLLSLVALPALAGGDHDHGEGSFTGASSSTSFALPQEVINNLKIETVTADLAPVQETVKLVAQIKLLPEKQAVITPRFQGKAIDIKAKIGEKISRGQPLVVLEPLTIGSSPVTLSAPIEGVLTQQNVVLGQVVDAGDVLMEVADRSQVLAKGLTYESEQLGKIRIGQAATLRIDSFQNRNFSGVIQRIDPSIDEKDRTFAVYALVENPEFTLLPHMQGDLTVAVGEEETLLTVPQRAVLGTVGQHFVYVQDGDHFEKRMVELGVRKGEAIEIISGIFPGEAVVTQGSYQLQYVTPEGSAAKSPAQGDHGHPH